MARSGSFGATAAPARGRGCGAVLVALAALAVLAVPARAQDATIPDDVFAVMEARERATRPFEVTYRVGDRRGDAGPAVSRGEVSVAWTDVARQLRIVAPLGRYVIGEAPSSGRLENLLLERDGRTVDLHRRLTPQPGPWDGTIHADNLRIVDFDSPLRFGLVWAGRPFSDVLRQRVVVPLGTAEVAGRRCVGVRFDVDPGAAAVGVPVDAWLSVAHGYYPVRVLHYGRDDGTNELCSDERVAVGASSWGVVAELSVTTLVPAGPGWVPGEAVLRTRSGGELREVRLQADPSSVRHGPAVAFDGELPADARGVVVRDVSTGQRVPLGTASPSGPSGALRVGAVAVVGALVGVVVLVLALAGRRRAPSSSS